MPGLDLPGARWRTSSYSGGGGSEGNCVEVAIMLDDGVAVRDSKDRGGAVHRHTVAAWRTFLDAVRAGEFGGA
jgi:hypothetical protein